MCGLSAWGSGGSALRDVVTFGIEVAFVADPEPLEVGDGGRHEDVSAGDGHRTVLPVMAAKNKAALQNVELGWRPVDVDVAERVAVEDEVGGLRQAGQYWPHRD